MWCGWLKPPFNLSKSHISLKHVKRIQQRGGRFQSTLKRWYSDAVVEFSVKCATTTELPFLLFSSNLWVLTLYPRRNGVTAKKGVSTACHGCLLQPAAWYKCKPLKNALSWEQSTCTRICLPQKKKKHLFWKSRDVPLF